MFKNWMKYSAGGVLFLSLLFLISCNSTKIKNKKSGGDVSSSSSAAKRSLTDSILLENELNKKSKEYYESLLSSGELEHITYDARMSEIRNIANKLSLAMGFGLYNKKIHLVRNKTNPNQVNAFVLPTGEIFLYEGILELCQRKARSDSGGNKEEEGIIFEGLMAGVLGHEQGHYYGKHQLKSILRKHISKNAGEQREEIKRLNLSKEALVVEEIESEQNLEIQADLFGIQAMGKAGYEPFFMEEVLRLLKTQSSGDNPYTSTHPSFNKRISYITNNKEVREYSTRMLNLEYAFASVETGYKLDEAVTILQRELNKSPSNEYLLSTLARVYHRLWEKSCEISELRFKSSIVFSPFQENMYHPVTMGTPDGKIPRKIWCNGMYYEAALENYREAIRNFAGPLTLTSYAVLLAYHPSEYKMSMDFGIKAFKDISEEDILNKMRSLNNLGIIFFMNERFQESLNAFGQVASESVPLIGAGAYDAKAENVLNQLSGKNMGVLLEGIFNFGSIFMELSYLDEFQNKRDMLRRSASDVWTNYTMLDSETEWGKYALAKSKDPSKKIAYYQPIVVMESSIVMPDKRVVPSRMELKLGMNEKELEKLENSSTSKLQRGVSRGIARGVSRGFSRGFSMGLTINVANEKIIGIRLDKINSYPVLIKEKNVEVKIGMGKEYVESILGKPKLAIGNTIFYPEYYMILQYDPSGKIGSIVLNHVPKE